MKCAKCGKRLQLSPEEVVRRLGPSCLFKLAANIFSDEEVVLGMGADYVLSLAGKISAGRRENRAGGRPRVSGVCKWCGKEQEGTRLKLDHERACDYNPRNMRAIQQQAAPRARRAAKV